MIYIIATLNVINFEALKVFETSATRIMARHGGTLLFAITTQTNEATKSGEEIHILEFPDVQSFNNYQQDAELKALAHLRRNAIADISVVISTQRKFY